MFFMDSNLSKFHTLYDVSKSKHLFLILCVNPCLGLRFNFLYFAFLVPFSQMHFVLFFLTFFHPKNQSCCLLASTTKNSEEKSLGRIQSFRTLSYMKYERCNCNSIGWEENNRNIMWGSCNWCPWLEANIYNQIQV